MPIGRLRAIDPGAGTLDIDFVRHADAGPGGRFAESATPTSISSPATRPRCPRSPACCRRSPRRRAARSSSRSPMPPSGSRS
ncbi:MAG: hypothetical protein DI556_22935 [Rhodovulum sulfidophilum]|uniref:Siderophore-interacting FAD-binding domain-containing protein n=1 Tax=Rhodovulum sulfidophilum TaxID=35806 RepID=A0A2W5N3D3_RHOSU|nr:MAG: hypothetical protein DI556_22935 [Rhodovulum sulfidophilum]